MTAPCADPTGAVCDLASTTHHQPRERRSSPATCSRESIRVLYLSDSRYSSKRPTIQAPVHHMNPWVHNQKQSTRRFATYRSLGCAKRVCARGSNCWATCHCCNTNFVQRTKHRASQATRARSNNFHPMNRLKVRTSPVQHVNGMHGQRHGRSTFCGTSRFLRTIAHRTKIME